MAQPDLVECYESSCMADREWPSINPGERVCIHCPRFAGKDLPDPRKKTVEETLPS